MSTTIELKVTGMTCDHCVRAVTNALKDVAGVEEAVVSLDTHSARVVGQSVKVESLLEAVAEEGYEAAVAP